MEKGESRRDRYCSRSGFWKLWKSENVVNRYARREEDVFGLAGPSKMRYKFLRHKWATMKEVCKEISQEERKKFVVEF